MTETESTTGRAMTDPETDELAEIVERAETDDAAAVALEEAGGPSPLPEEPPEEPAVSVESDAATEPVDDVPEAGVEEPAPEVAAVAEVADAPELAEVAEVAPPPK
ncbi:MAG: cytoskeleton assembly control protein, partial [Actinobacteria bacterium]|nr:cytoskeleton assembly control protein [Actinomycetota bacterium]